MRYAVRPEPSSRSWCAMVVRLSCGGDLARGVVGRSDCRSGASRDRATSRAGVTDLVSATGCRCRPRGCGVVWLSRSRLAPLLQSAEGEDAVGRGDGRSGVSRDRATSCDGVTDLVSAVGCRYRPRGCEIVWLSRSRLTPLLQGAAGEDAARRSDCRSGASRDRATSRAGVTDLVSAIGCRCRPRGCGVVWLSRSRLAPLLQGGCGRGGSRASDCRSGVSRDRATSCDGVTDLVSAIGCRCRPRGCGVVWLSRSRLAPLLQGAAGEDAVRRSDCRSGVSRDRGTSRAGVTDLVSAVGCRCRPRGCEIVWLSRSRLTPLLQGAAVEDAVGRGDCRSGVSRDRGTSRAGVTDLVSAIGCRCRPRGCEIVWLSRSRLTPLLQGAAREDAVRRSDCRSGASRDRVTSFADASQGEIA